MPLAVLAASLLLASPAAAASACEEDLSYLFCPAMEVENAYKQRGFRAYERLIPGADGWIFRTGTDLKTDFTLPPHTLRYLKALSSAFRAKGTRLIMLYIPTRGLMHADHLAPGDAKKYGFTDTAGAWKSYEDTIRAMNAAGIEVVGLPRPKGQEPFFYKRDHHWNADGAKRAAQTLASHIRNLPEYKNVAKEEFTTREGERYVFYGVSKKVFKKLCDTIQPPEVVKKYVTERKGAATDGESLFGDAKSADIVLMGTSNSTQEPAYANFEGFLKEALSADVLNMSVSGGGLDSAMISYLNSGDFKAAPAKIAIWEVPSYYDIATQPSFFREAIPAVHGDCGENAVAKADKVRLSRGTDVVLSDIGGKGIKGDSYYVSLRFSKPVSQPFLIDMRHGKKRERYKFHPLQRLQTGNQYYLSLGDLPAPLEKIFLETPEGLAGQTVDVKVCKIPAEGVNGARSRI